MEVGHAKTAPLASRWTGKPVPISMQEDGGNVPTSTALGQIRHQPSQVSNERFPRRLEPRLPRSPIYHAFCLMHLISPT